MQIIFAIDTDTANPTMAIAKLSVITSVKYSNLGACGRGTLRNKKKKLYNLRELNRQDEQVSNKVSTHQLLNFLLYKLVLLMNSRLVVDTVCL